MIRIIYVGNYIKVKFDYNSKLTKIMRSFQAQYYSKDKSWSLPLEKVEDLIEELTFQGYDISQIGNEEFKVVKEK